jgi:uncharacterized membrane protein
MQEAAIMFETIGAVLSGLIAAIIGLFAAILGLGLGFGALTVVLLPLLLMLILPFLPVILLLLILRGLGLVRGVFPSLLVLLGGALLLLAAAHYGWSRGLQQARDWFEDNREVLEACANQNAAHITLETGGGLHFTCIVPKRPRRDDDL